MSHRRIAVLLLGSLSLVACTGTGSSSGEPSPRTVQPPMAPPPALPAADPREVKLSAAVVALLEGQHLRRHPIDDEISRKAFKRYLEALDPGKMFLLAADAAQLAHHADRIDDELRSGRLELAHAGTATLAHRVAVVQKMVQALLAAPFDHQNDEYVEIDAKKLALATSDDALRERWRQRLELEVLERVDAMDERAKALAKEGDKGKDKRAGAGKAEGKGKPAAPDPDAVPVEPARPPVEDGTPVLSAAQIPATFEAREAKARADLSKSYAGRFARLAAPAPLDAAATLVNAVCGTFNPHTDYLPPPDQANFNIQMSGSLEGIGAVLREDDHYIRVVEIVPGGASWRQGGLEAGDLIHAVAQAGKEPVDVGDMRIDDVVQMIRGPKGTDVTLTIEKPAGEAISSLTITRDVVVIEEAYARGAVVQPKGGKGSFGYIYLPSFYGTQGGRSSASDVRRLLEEMAKKKVAGVVLDVRGNGGGLLDDARVMTGLLIDKGPVVQTQLPDGERETLSDDVAGTTFDRPVVVMTDRFSASASEILAGALQDYHRAVIVGTGPTHGKGTVQVLADLDRQAGPGEPHLGELKLTVQQFFRVSGASTQWKGVVPDVDLPDPAGYLETGERSLENSIPWSQIEAVPHDDWPATWQIADLVARSQKRTVASETFRKIAARTEILRARKDDTRLPLALPAWQAQRDKQKAQLEEVTPDLEKGPARLSVTMVPYDGKAPTSARPGGQADDRIARWRQGVARDPWIEEALAVLRDMQGGRAAAAAGVTATDPPATPAR